MNAYFYERCGVSSVDLAYPSNGDMFGELVTETPAVIYKYPIAEMLDYSIFDKPGQLGSLKLNPINNWGKLYPASVLGMQ